MRIIFTVLILFCFSFGYSQPDIRVNIFNPDSAYKYYLLQAEITVGMLFEYEKECYNDSLLIEEGFNDANAKFGLSEGYYYQMSIDGKYYPRYIHVQPTFTGFLEYLHRKTKTK